MPAWTAFGAVVAVVLALLLALSWLTQRAMSDGSGVDGAEAITERPATDGATDEAEVVTVGDVDDPSDAGVERAVDAVGPAPPTGAGPTDESESERGPRESESEDRAGESVVGTGRTATERAEAPDATPGIPADSPAARTLTAERELSGGVLLANVAASQGTFAVVLAVAAVATGIPLAPLGLTRGAFAVGPLATGVLVGVGLAVANQGAARLFRRLDVAFSEELRELLAPETPAEWAALALGVLPLVAVFEEFLFRAILIGAFATGFGVDPWVLVVVSSALFAAGHSAQGAAGIVVTGALGLVLGAAFVVTGSFAAVALAHYLVNLLEFLVHER